MFNVLIPFGPTGERCLFGFSRFPTTCSVCAAFRWVNVTENRLYEWNSKCFPGTVLPGRPPVFGFCSTFCQWLGKILPAVRQAHNIWKVRQALNGNGGKYRQTDKWHVYIMKLAFSLKPVHHYSLFKLQIKPYVSHVTSDAYRELF